MRRDRQHRHAGAVAIEQAVDEMQIARAATTGADGERAGKVRLGAGGEGRDLLVADMHPFDLALLANGVGYAVQAVPDDAIDAFDAGYGEIFGELFGNGGHDCTLFSI